MNRPAAQATRLVEDDADRHGHDYVITAITECRMLLEEPGGTRREVTVGAGQAYKRPEGVEHNVINAADVPMSFVEVELK